MKEEVPELAMIGARIQVVLPEPFEVVTPV
jgi:hypothetical protein